MTGPANARGHGLCRIADIRAVERAALARLAPGTLMERAAQAVAAEAERLLRALPAGTEVRVLAGPGANGADALLAALRLGQAGYRTRAWSLGADLPADADSAAVHRRWRAAHGAPAALAGFAQDAGTSRALVLDGLFGIGLARPVAGAAAAALAHAARAGWPVLAVDVPSGIDADTGAIVGGPAGAASRAVATVTMIADKPGLHTGEGRAHAGRVIVAGLDAGPVAAAGVAIDADWMRGRLGRRGANTHKGSFGTVMIVGGAAGMEGAALLAGRGAQAAGAGRTIVASPETRPFDPGQPQLMSRQLVPDRPPPAAVRQAFDGVTTLVAGCGLGRSGSATAWLAAALDADCPLVLDADGLNLCAASPELARALAGRTGRGAATVLTPHPLEAGRLLGRPAADIQADRIAAACELAQRFRAVVLLKGAGTVLAGPDGDWGIVTAGGPALASAGTGDVLAGVTGALLGQHPEPFAAAGMAAWLHADAGDRWTARHPGERGLAAARLAELVTEAIDAID